MLSYTINSHFSVKRLHYPEDCTRSTQSLLKQLSISWHTVAFSSTVVNSTDPAPSAPSLPLPPPASSPDPTLLTYITIALIKFLHSTSFMMLLQNKIKFMKFFAELPVKKLKKVIKCKKEANIHSY